MSAIRFPVIVRDPRGRTVGHFERRGSRTVRLADLNRGCELLGAFRAGDLEFEELLTALRRLGIDFVPTPLDADAFSADAGEVAA